MVDMMAKTFTRPTKPAGGKVAIYARVALDEDGALEKQAKELIDFAESIGDNTYHVYYEAASGLVEARKEFSKLLTDMKVGQYKRLYIKDLSRLSRNMVLVEKLIKEIESMGVEISVIQP